MSAVIELSKVSFWYERGKLSEFRALKDISLTIEKGEYIAFFGPSGSGKSTLLYLVSGIEQPHEGKVVVNQKDVSALSKKELAYYRQSGVGIVFQQFNLIPSLTVLDNVTLPMALMGKPLGARREEGAKLLKRLGIEAFAGRYPFELSGGQQQRVGIARALANNPPIIIADEPLGNLDSDNAQKVLAILKELHEKDGRTVIMVTHEAWSLRDVGRVFFIRDGIVQKSEKSGARNIVESVTHHYLKELNPGADGHLLGVQGLAELLLRGYSKEETDRFAGFLAERLAKKITAAKFRTLLDLPFNQGGIGFWKRKAREVSAEVETLIERRGDVHSAIKKYEKNPRAALASELEHIKNWIMAERRGRFAARREARLTTLVKEYLHKHASEAACRSILAAPVHEGGIGLSPKSAARVIDRLRVVMNQ